VCVLCVSVDFHGRSLRHLGSSFPTLSGSPRSHTSVLNVPSSEQQRSSISWSSLNCPRILDQRGTRCDRPPARHAAICRRLSRVLLGNVTTTTLFSSPATAIVFCRHVTPPPQFFAMSPYCRIVPRTVYVPAHSECTSPCLTPSAHPVSVPVPNVPPSLYLLCSRVIRTRSSVSWTVVVDRKSGCERARVCVAHYRYCYWIQLSRNAMLLMMMMIRWTVCRLSSLVEWTFFKNGQH